MRKILGRKGIVVMILTALVVAAFVGKAVVSGLTTEDFKIFCYTIVGLGGVFCGGNGLEHIGQGLAPAKQ